MQFQQKCTGQKEIDVNIIESKRIWSDSQKTKKVNPETTTQNTKHEEQRHQHMNESYKKEALQAIYNVYSMIADTKEIAEQYVSEI